MAPPPGLSFGQKVKFALSSPSNFHEAIKLESASSRLINEDLLPSPPERWTWTLANYFGFWWSESWNVSTWAIGASMVALGMTVRDAILVVFFANLLSAVFIVLNGRGAAVYHIGYPVISRMSFGLWGHYFAVIIRAILGIIWGGVQLYFEGQFISIMLRCIFTSWERVPNTIPTSQFITTQGMVGFFLAFCVTLPFMFVHTARIQLLFTVKSVILPFCGLGIVIWATKNNGGVSAGSVENPAVKGSQMTFAFSVISQFNAVMGANSALLVTVPDIARYSKHPRDQLWGQLLGLPMAQTICAAFGIITTAAVINMWGEAYWAPYDLLNGILDHSYDPRSRAGCFFAAFCFAFATLGTSIACNIIPFGADVTCLLPKYISIIRGQILCLIIAFSIVPWRIVSTANGFLTFLNGYSIFQGPVVAIMLVDYFIIRNGNINIPALYTTSSDSIYYYTKGWNPRAFAAFIIGFILPLPGFIGTFGTTTASEAASHMFSLGWPLSTVMGGLSYWLISVVWKVPGYELKEKQFESTAERDARYEIDGVVVKGSDSARSMDEKDSQV